MANLSGFLKPAYFEKTAEAVISDRFIGEDGEPLKFVMKTMPQEKLKSILNRSLKQVKDKNKVVGQEVDQDLFTVRCIVESCVQPDFKQQDICDAYGCVDPYSVPEKMLNAGEFKKLSQMFLDLNDLDNEKIDLMAVTKN